MEDGKIQFAIHETMVAGNLADLLTSIRAVGNEPINNGGNSYPPLATSGATISTK